MQSGSEPRIPDKQILEICHCRSETTLLTSRSSCEACSAFTRVAACTLTRSPYFLTRYPKASAWIVYRRLGPRHLADLQNVPLDITSRLSLRFLRDQELRRQTHGGDLRRLHGSRSATADPEARPRQANCNRRGQATGRSAYPSWQPAADAALLPRRAAQHPHQRSMMRPISRFSFQRGNSAPDWNTLQ